MSNDRYPNKCYKQMKALNDMGRTNWTSDIKKFLFTLGFGNVWQYQDNLSDVKRFLYDLKNRLIDVNMQNLHSKLKEKSEVYYIYSTDHFYPSTDMAPYIKLPINYRKRRLFSLLRIIYRE